jgi:hypothetical protein
MIARLARCFTSHGYMSSILLRAASTFTVRKHRLRSRVAHRSDSPAWPLGPALSLGTRDRAAVVGGPERRHNGRGQGQRRSERRRVRGAIATSAPGAASALSSLIASAPTTSLNLGSVINYGPYSSLQVNTSKPISASVSALDLLTATAQLVNGTHQVQTALTLSAPPIASATLALTIGERPVGESFVTIGATG